MRIQKIGFCVLMKLDLERRLCLLKCFLCIHVHVCLVLLLGQYHCEEGLGEWVEFTSDQRYL